MPASVFISIVTESEPGRTKKGFFSGIRQLIAEQLRQGLTPRQLALALAVGGTIGAMPLVWGTSLLCVLLAGLLRLNQAVVQTANFLVYPLQILFFLPYLKWGEALFSNRLLPSGSEALVAQLRSAPLEFFQHFWLANAQALLIWLLSVPLILGGLYGLSLQLLIRLKRLTGATHIKS